ncbi:hypothetical protein B0H14DRAFT_3660081 [Mycena olivaceomarginata]|nr:hypothetical protein B0H14DRAFT_3660081 [Mycena olivaceomarginata]
MSSSHTFSWEPLFNGPNPPLAGLARDFEGYSFDTSGFGEDLEVEITQLPSERAKDATTNTINDAPSSPSPFPPSPFSSTPYPFVDLSTLPIQTPARAPDTLAISRPFPVPHPTPLPAPFVVRDLNSFPALPGSDIPFQYPPARPDDFRIAADRKRGVIDDTTRRAIGNSGADKENPVAAADESSRAGKSKFNGNDLIGFARAAVDCNPWLAATGRRQKDFRHPNMNATTLQHKCEAMINFKKDPKGKNKNLAKVIGYDEAKDKSDDAKAVIKKKNDTDREGGEAIRQASLPTRRSPRQTRRPPALATLPLTPTETWELPTTTPKTTSASSSIEIVDGAKDKKPAKRRRLHERRSASSKDALIDLFREENQRRAEHDNRVATSLDTFVKDSREQKAEFTSLLRDLIASDRSN